LATGNCDPNSEFAYYYETYHFATIGTWQLALTVAKFDPTSNAY